MKAGNDVLVYPRLAATETKDTSKTRVKTEISEKMPSSAQATSIQVMPL